MCLFLLASLYNFHCVERINFSIGRRIGRIKNPKLASVSLSLPLYLHKKCHPSKKRIKGDGGRIKDLLMAEAVLAAEETKPIVNRVKK